MSRPPKPQHKVRLSIELLCKVLCINGTFSVVPETIRKAKFNNEEAVKPLWTLLHEVCMLVCSDTLSSLHPDSHELFAMVTEAMTVFGYQKQDNLTLNMTTGSRDLLLAFSWLLAKERLAERIVLDALRTLPVDIHSLHKPTNEQKKENVTNLSDMALGDRLRQVVWLLGKCKMSLRSLVLLTQERTTLIDKINTYTSGVTLSSFAKHLSVLETFVLRHPQHLSEVQIILENTNSKLDSYLKWKENESVFWNWMESVVDFKLQDAVPPKELKTLTPSLYAPTVHHPSRERAGTSTRVRHLHKLDSQLQTSIEQWRLCAADLDNKIKAMVCNEKQATNPSKVMNSIQQDIYAEISGYQSRNVVPRNMCCQRFLHIRKPEKKKKAEFSPAQKKTTSERTFGTVEEKLDIEDELCRLESKVKERKEFLQQLRYSHQEELESIFHGVKCICIPPLAQKK